MYRLAWWLFFRWCSPWFTTGRRTMAR